MTLGGFLVSPLLTLPPYYAEVTKFGVDDSEIYKDGTKKV